MFIILLIAFYIAQIILAITGVWATEISTKKEFYKWLIPYPYWIVISIIWSIKETIKAFKKLK